MSAPFDEADPANCVILLNGETRALPQGMTVADLLTEIGADGPGVAVERNRIVVRKRDWAAIRLEAGDEIEVVRLIGGG